MTNKYDVLKVEEPNGVFINTENQLRNCKKNLKNKQKRHTITLDEDLKKEIRILESAILEYENKNISILKKKKKKNRELNDDNTMLNKVIKQIKLDKIKKEEKQNRINKLWKRFLVNKNCVTGYPEWGKKHPLSYMTESPRWSIQTHSLFPDNMKKIIIGLFCYNINEDTIFSTLPKEVMENIVNQFHWVDFPEKDKNKNVVFVNKKGKQKKTKIRWST